LEPTAHAFRWRRSAQRDAGELDPAIDAARIRAFFVDPDYARRGIGRALLEQCEAAARAQGFTSFELMSTLTGMPLYLALGYQCGDLVRYRLAADLTIEFVPMRKRARRLRLTSNGGRT
jgi:GNAT superfamily N-acetyltransferase